MNPISTVLIVLASFAVILSPVSANIFLRLEGIPGDSQERNHKRWIEVESVGMVAPKNRDSIAGLQFRKRIDRSSPLIANACAQGLFLSEAEIDFTTLNENGLRSYAGLTIRDVLISSVEQQFENDVIHELITVQLRSVFFRYSQSEADERSFIDLAQGEDSDGDGMSDRYEDYHGFDKNVQDGDLDADGDGYTNRQESRLGTNPRSASSGFTVSSRRKQNQNGNIEITWKTKPGNSYDIYFTSDLARPFQYQETLVADDVESALEITGANLRGFYQVREAIER